MEANMKTVESLLNREGITLKGDGSNTLLVDENVPQGKRIWGKLDSISYIGYKYETV